MSCGPEDEVVCKNLGDAIDYILEVFDDYEEDGKISKEDFETLLKEEFSDSECKKKIDETGLETILSKIDKKEDGVNLKEYSRLIKFMITGQLCRKKGGDKEKGKGRRRRGRGKGKGKGKCQKEEDE